MHSITIRSDKPLVVIPADEYESMKETLELLATNPSLPDELNEERRNVAKGNFITWSGFRTKYKVK